MFSKIVFALSVSQVQFPFVFTGCFNACSDPAGIPVLLYGGYFFKRET